jgi:uncharacterized membrane protein YfcA
LHYKRFRVTFSGLCAGAVNGLFGAGGGMVLIPLLRGLTDLGEDEIFPASISIILPMCLVTLWVQSQQAPIPCAASLPYLLGSAAGGILAGLLGKKIPTKWLHRVLGLMILYGGWRYLT